MNEQASASKLAPLPHEIWYGAVVLAIQHGAERFKKQNQSEWTYCHFITLLVEDPKGINPEGREIKAQLCTEKQNFSGFDIDDIIKYRTNKYVSKYDRYTIASWEMVKKKGAAANMKDEDLDPSQPQYAEGFEGMEESYPEIFDRKSVENIEVESPRQQATVNGISTPPSKEQKTEQWENKGGMKNFAMMLPNGLHKPYIDKHQLMATAQHNAALFFQMRGNVTDDQMLSLSEKLYKQMLDAK